MQMAVEHLLEFILNVSIVFSGVAMTSCLIFFSEKEFKIMKMTASLWGRNVTKFMTLKCDISRTSSHMKISDGVFFLTFHAL